ncbi:zinc dependent phospholipase C family protein [Compostibacter hankyongensis]|uniref:S1/P1 Nuclease n=1 Tax=Compostibacter hankyongensis TaxID=1007089 RepID=A0ABP8FH92_9BACT
MKRYPFLPLLLIGALLLPCSLLLAWGRWGHQHIDRAAIFALPEGMRAFFFNHADFITEESVLPDVRKYTINDRAEPDRHYIDLEAYGKDPFKTLPHDWTAAKKKYGEKMLHKNGILPWYVPEMMEKLTRAFRERDKSNILFIAADLGHYLGDATQPLHTTLNYDGQLSDQKGIHAFFESQLPERFGAAYNFHVSPARYLDDPVKEIWNILQESHALVDTVLLAEKRLAAQFPASRKYVTDASGKPVKNSYGQPVHSLEYAKAYHDALQGAIEKLLRRAVQATADYWYTAWVNAGKPRLDSLDAAALTARNKRFLKKEYRRWQKQGKLWGLHAGAEF